MIHKLDALAQKLSKGKSCLYCGKPAECMHHFVRRWNRSTRWLPDNLQAVCLKCHNKIHDGNLEEKKAPEYIKVVGKMLFKDVCRYFGKTKQEMMKHYEKKLKEILNDM